MPCSSSQSSNAPGQPAISSVTGRRADAASISTTGSGAAPRTSSSSSGLCRSTTRGGRRRWMSAISACVSGSDRGRVPGQRAIRAMFRAPQRRIDAGRVGERLVRAPGRSREVPVEVHARVVLARPREQPVGVHDRDDGPGRLASGHALEQAASEQCRDRLLAVLGRRQQPGERPVRPGQEDVAARRPDGNGRTRGPASRRGCFPSRPDRTGPARTRAYSPRHAHHRTRSSRPDRRAISPRP